MSQNFAEVVEHVKQLSLAEKQELLKRDDEERKKASDIVRKYKESLREASDSPQKEQ